MSTVREFHPVLRSLLRLSQQTDDPTEQDYVNVCNGIAALDENNRVHAYTTCLAFKNQQRGARLLVMLLERRLVPDEYVNYEVSHYMDGLPPWAQKAYDKVYHVH